MRKTENLDEFVEILEKIQNSSFQIIYVASDIVRLGLMAKEKNPRKTCQLIAELLYQKLKSKTVIFPTATLSFCSNNKVFNAKTSASENMGVLNEFLRWKYSEIRSDHPFWSNSGWGSYASILLRRTSRNAYGADSLWDRLLNYKTLVLNIGVDISNSMTVIHHLEQIHGVPYRYSKIFRKNIINYDGYEECNLFTLNVIRKDIRLVRDRNRKLCENFSPFLLQDSFSDVQTYDYQHFYKHLDRKLRDNIFTWVQNEDEVRDACLKISD